MSSADLSSSAGTTATRSLSGATRQELYDLVWSTPASRLAHEFGVSDVAIAKRCKRLGVPRPSRGYWAKIEAGKKKPRKPPLPPTADELFFEAAGKPVGKSKRLPQELNDLNPVAKDLLAALNSAKPDSEKRVRLHQPTLPNVTVSKALAERTARAFAAIVTEAEARGIPFRKGQSSYDGGFFRKGNDRIYLEFEEELIDKPSRGKRATSAYGWGERDSRIPSGKLTVSLKADRYVARDAKRWIESDQLSVEEILARAIEEICRHFIDAQKRHAQEAIEQEKRRVKAEERHRKWQGEEAVRRKEERERTHAEAIEAVMRHRKDDLLKAAESWRLHEAVHEFISTCEQRWRNQEGSKQLTAAQESWLAWARQTANALSPFESGYPEPGKDGLFSPIRIPIGGPYPETREFSRPPTMPEIPAPVVVQQSYGSSQRPAPEPYPFWLKYPRR